ncbi:MAG: hypothetical protein ABI414_09805 [Devosia sp.]
MRRDIAIAAVLIGMAGPASAGVVEGRFEIEGGCYVRKYDAAHLRSHPNQVVTQISLETARTQTERDLLTLTLQFSTRQGSHYSAQAYCSANDRCSIEGDGGTFRLTGDGPRIKLTVGEFLAIEGNDDFSPNLADSDDRVFLLDAC